MKKEKKMSDVSEKLMNVTFETTTNVPSTLFHLFQIYPYDFTQLKSTINHFSCPKSWYFDFWEKGKWGKEEERLDQGLVLSDIKGVHVTFGLVNLKGSSRVFIVNCYVHASTGQDRYHLTTLHYVLFGFNLSPSLLGWLASFWESHEYIFVSSS